ncbi:MAG: hypothetical protein DWQ36_02195 [Acidobacteria bacterium]|nr:MAG: hypothetical protein DWQ30_23585 [Acidobacteriota bacterium]REK11256.1 MAG: hypothetical protein DWQ36_02195 [Acidobacteriota bacterium]
MTAPRDSPPPPDGPALATRCPRCEYDSPPAIGAFAECPRCGVVVAKFVRAPPTATEAATEPPDPGPDREGPQTDGDLDLATVADGGTLYDPDQHAAPETAEDRAPAIPVRFSQRVREAKNRDLVHGFDREVQWGAAIGALLWLLPPTRALGSYLNVLVHEIGHTATYWLFGYLTIPSFDFVNHGGLSVAFARLETLTLVVVALLGFWIWQARGHRRIQVFAASILVLYSLLNWTQGHQHLFDAMGHGGELVFATIFLQRALAPAHRFDTLERPLWAAAGVFVTLQLIAFSWTLALSASRQSAYAQGMRGFRHDLLRIADWLGLPLPLVAASLGLLALLPPLVAFWVHRHGESWRQAFIDLLAGPQSHGDAAPRQAR